MEGERKERMLGIHAGVSAVFRIKRAHQTTRCAIRAAWLVLIIGIISAYSFDAAGKNPNVKILYFFSESCIHCMAAKPSVIDLSKTYDVEGLRFGQGNAQSWPFPVKSADKNIMQAYGVKGYPTLAVLVDGIFKQKIAGTSDVLDAKVIIRALANGAMTVTEAARKDGTGEITITGWISAKGNYFKNAQFSITDRSSELPVSAWLPLEAVKSPFRNKGPRLMSDVIKKPVVLKGSIQKTATGVKFRVKEEIPID